MPYTPPYRRKPEQSKAPKHDFFDKITLGVAIVGVIVIAISAGISAWQAVIATRQRTVMQAQLDVTKIQLRPYVGIEMLHWRPYVSPQGDQAHDVVMEFKNYGGTPAFFVLQWMSVKITPPAVAADYDLSKPAGGFITKRPPH